MHRWDKLYWQYYLLLESHYEAEAVEQARKKAENSRRPPTFPLLKRR